MKSIPATTPVRTAALLLVLALAGCSSTEGLFSGDKIDYRTQSSKTQALDVPPDLTQLARDGRYQPQSGVVSASTMRAPATSSVGTPSTTANVAPAAVGEVKVMHDGAIRWLAVPTPPEKLYAELRAFWLERGFTLATDSPELGLMETEWAENRAKLPQDLVRRTLGRVLDSLYSTGERDRFRTRIERNAAGGSDVYITHKGMEEVYSNAAKDQTVWQPRPRDTELEAEFLTRLMVRLGSKDDAAAQALAAARPAGATTPAARPVAGERRAPALPATATMDLPEAFDRAWRLVGLALDRGGFTIEDRDRSAGLYFVRYVDPRTAGREEPNFFQRLFSGGDKEARPQRYRVQVKSSSAGSTITVQTSEGQPDNSETARQIMGRLGEELRP